MTQYKSLERYTLGNTIVFVVENDIERQRDNNDLIGSTVQIDGKTYKVKGVESYAVPVIYKGQKIGLMVKNEPIS